MSTAITHPSIVNDPAMLNAAPIIEDTRTPVRAIAEMWNLV